MRHRSSQRKLRILRQARQSAVGRFCQQTAGWLLVGALALAPLAYGLTPPWAVLGFEALIWAAALFWLLSIVMEHEIKLVMSPLIAPILVFACYVVVRYALTDVESLARPEMMLAVTSALVFLLTTNTLQRRDQVIWLAAMWTTLGTVIAVYGLWQIVANDSRVWLAPQPGIYQGRASGPFLRPSHFGGYLGLCFYLGAAFFFFSRLGYRMKIALALACVAMAVAALFSFSLAAWLGWLAGAVVLGACVVGRRSLRFRWLAVGSVVWLALVLGAMIAVETQQLTGNEPPRLLLWRSAWSIAKDNLIIGAGPGLFRWLYPSERVLQGVVPGVGNEFLNLLVDYGLIGVGLVIWALIAFFAQGVKVIRARARRYSVTALSNRYALAIGGVAAMVAAGVQGAFDLNLHSPAILFSLIALMGLVMTCGVHPTTRQHGAEQTAEEFVAVPVRGLLRWGLIGSLAVVLVLLGARVRQAVPAEYYLWRAEQAQRQLDWQAAEVLVNRAWRHDPQSYRVALAGAEFQLARATWTPAPATARWSEAARWYERAYIRNPHDGGVLIKLGRILDQQGKREQAFERYTRALNLDPLNASYHAQLGLHYQRWDQLDQAIASFRRAYELGGPDFLAEIKLRELGLL